MLARLIMDRGEREVREKARKVAELITHLVWKHPRMTEEETKIKEKVHVYIVSLSDSNKRKQPLWPAYIMLLLTAGRRELGFLSLSLCQMFPKHFQTHADC